MEQHRKPITGPLTIGLHDDGVTYLMQRNQRISKVRLYDGMEVYGYQLGSAEARQLQLMSVNGYISRIETGTTDIAADRKNLIDLTKLLTYGMLYRQFDARIWDIIMDSSLTTMWNRQFPKVAIGFGMNVRNAGIMAVIKKNEAAITAFKQQLLKAVQQKVLKNRNELDEDRRKKMYLAIRYLNMVDPVVWLLLTVYRDQFDSKMLLDELRSSLEVYLDRSESPEYLALMLIEMIIIVGGLLGETGTPDATSQTHAPVNLSMEFSAKKREKNERTRMRILIARESPEFEILREKVDEKSNMKLKEKSLDHFFSSGFGSEMRNKDLGLYYLSYLRDACRKMNISFESFVNYIPSTKQSQMNLVLTF